MTVFTSKFPNSARDVVVSCTVPDEKSWIIDYRKRKVVVLQIHTKMFCNTLHKITHTTILPCTCSVQPLFWSYRYEACPLFHSLPHQRDKSHSAGRHLLGWPEEVTCPARTHRAALKNRGHMRPTDHSSTFHRLHSWTDVLPYMRGTLLVCHLWGGRAAVFRMAARSDLGSPLLKPSSASALWRRWVWIIGHSSFFI